jgi:DNA topoisomerase I
MVIQPDEKYQLIITEKPNAAKKIADALADGKPIKEGKGAYYYKITHGNQDIIVACAVGHLYGLTEIKKPKDATKPKEKQKWNFPIFNIEWKPTSETNKSSAFTKKYLTTIKKLAKNATSYVVATDYDIEGEVIGLNIIRYACKQKDAFRMKFSTLTKDDLIESYGNMEKTLDWGQANAGETRHILDWFWGINSSRALMSSIKKAGMFKILSTGRVQGPALKLIVDKEREISVFKPDPFWQIQMDGIVKDTKIIAMHKEDKFWEQEKADAVMSKVNNEKEATISNVEKKQFNQAPPTPFDLTSLQLEASKTLKISPKITLEIAQDLYTAGFISYPRTSSQQLSDKIGFKKILTQLGKQKNYKKETEFLLKKKSLVPNNGKKTDPAHPAIYPTGIIPKLADKDKINIYDLITRRFLATFGDPATRETMKIEINCKDELFITKGTTTVAPGWHSLYGRFMMFKEEELPEVHKADKLNVEKITLLNKETQPPPRYTEASIIKELEKRNLGTKATRSSIVDTLYQRGYIDGRSMQATDLGIRTCSTLEKYVPEILDEELTRHFEMQMEEIRENKKQSEDVINEAKQVIIKIADGFKKQEDKIGEELKKANIETRDEMTTLGPCNACKSGLLQIRRGKFGFFAACNKYPDCQTTFSLPANAMIKPAKKQCEECNFPILLVIKKRKRPQEVCLNRECPGKKLDEEGQKLLEEMENGGDKPCPKCEKGKLVVRKSLYGAFLGCSLYPKCRHVKKLGNFAFKDDKKKETENNDESSSSN